MSLQDEQQELRKLLNEANALMDRVKEVFQLARDTSNNVLSLYHASIPGVIEELNANGGPTVARRRRTQLTGEIVMPNPEDIAERAIERGESPPVAVEFKRACANCGKPGHRRTSCPNPSKTANVPMGKRTCSRCRKPGHRATSCPKAKINGEM